LHTIRHNLFAINPTICSIVNVLHQFSNFQLIEWEPFLTKNAPFELRQFRSQLSTRIDKAQERLMQA
jgi:hypothetical protein